MSGFETVPGITLQDGEPVFSEPWEAQAFSLVVSMHEKGLFEWSEWAQVLGRVIAQSADDEPYYQSWLVALETIVAEKSLIEAPELKERKTQWASAVAATPHGQPIELSNAKGS